MKTLYLAIAIFLPFIINAQTEVSGHLTTNTVWTPVNNPYVVTGDVIVDEGVTLSIMPGTIIKFNGFWQNIVVDGSLNANGNAANKIYFTSIHDDVHGGDTNGNGNATQPGPDQWSSVFINPTGSATFSYCWLGYGAGEHSGLIDIYSNDVSIDNCEFHQSFQRGLYVRDASINVSNSYFEGFGQSAIFYDGFSDLKDINLSNNTFVNNRWAVFAVYKDNSTSLYLSGNTATGTDINGFGRGGFGLAGNMNGFVTWVGQEDFPFIIESDFTVNESSVLDISPGTTVKFEDFWDNLFVSGDLYADGTENDPIIFTSIHDDMHGGDTNANGNATQPGPDQWSSVFINPTGSATLSYCWLGYGAGEHIGLMDIYSNDVSIDNCEFHQSFQRGLYVRDASIDVSNSYFEGFGRSAIFYDGFSDLKDINLSNNTFVDNSWAIYSVYKGNSTNINLSGNTASGTDINGFGRGGFGLSGNMNGFVTWDGQVDFPLIIESDVTVNELASLTISPGTTVKFEDFWDNLFVSGDLYADGTENKPINFTSIHDDLHGGDTNANGNATLPAPEQWSSVFINPTGYASISHCWFGYGGGEHRGLIDSYSNDVFISNSTFYKSRDRGIYGKDVSLDINDCLFEENFYSGILFDGFSDSHDVVLSNNIFKNQEWAVFGNYKNNATSIYLTDNLSEGVSSNGFNDGYGRNGFGLVGTVEGSQVFQGQSDFPIIIKDDLIVSETASLTITPGSVIKFEDQWDNIWVNGYLSAEGQDFSPIEFTSIHDDSKGGDTNGNNSDTEPAPGNWSSIFISETGSADFEFCGLYYGAGEHSGLIDVYTSNVNVNHCSFFYSLDHGIYAKDASLSISNSNFHKNRLRGVSFNGVDSANPIYLENNAFSDHEWAVFANVRSQQVDIQMVNNISTGTSESGFTRHGFGIEGTIDGISSIQSQDSFPLVVWQSITVAETGSLDILSGSVVKFNDRWDHIFVDGSFSSLGTIEKPIFYTGIQDDCIGGDTNGDLDATEIGFGQWSGIQFNESSNNNILTYSELFYGAGISDAMLMMHNSDVVIDNCVIGQSNENGISVRSGRPTVTNTLIHDCAVGCRLYGVSEIDMQETSILKCSTWGMAADNPITVEGMNYWGSSHGPHNVSLYPDGRGVEINDNINIANGWLETLPQYDIIKTPQFDIMVHGRDVALENTSEYSDPDFRWILENSDTSNHISPFFSIPEPGNYEICLEGSNNCHTTIQNCQLIGIKGVSHFEPKTGGNTGTVTLNIAAGVPENISEVIIETNAGHEIAAFDYIISSEDVLTASFNLEDESIAESLIKLVYNDGSIAYSDEPFNIVQGEKAEPWLEITGHSAALINTWQTFDINFGNDANVDAYGVPLWIAVDNIPGIEIEFPNVEFGGNQYSIDMGRTNEYYDSVQVYVELDSLFAQPANVRVYPLYLNMIPANQDFTIKLRVKSASPYNIKVWMNEPYFNSPFNGRFAACITDIILNKFVEFIPGAACANTIIGSIFKPTARLQGDNKKMVVWPSMWDMFNIAVDCGKITGAAVNFAINVVRTVVNIKDDIQAIKDCKDNFDPVDEKDKPVNIFQSIDPNEKVGPVGVGPENYINYQEEINYTIYFENKSDATAPAHTIIIRDTLDTDAFDLTSLQLKEVQIGEERLDVLPDSKSFTGQIVLDHLSAVARITAEVDIETGIMVWEMRSLDPVSFDEITDPLVGILPPNINSPEGEGHVRFTVKLKNDPVHKFSFGNEASIYFDANDPIVTDRYINTFDLEAPETEVAMLEELYLENTIELELTGNDPESGIDRYEIWVSEDNSNFELWSIADASESSVIFEGQYGSSYVFYTLGIDNVGNKESAPGNPDASTMITSSSDLAGHFEYISIYPVPAQSILNIDLQLDETISGQIYISNTMGQKVMEISRIQQSEKLHVQKDVSALDPGLYLLTIEGNEKRYTEKIIIH